ncbi:hypothetical protein [Hanstruepera marina]|uniref:hypothetical protein n=1 Tax=Hanstruepera marina TaxID=2873265 RepID=UPI001CA6FE18|nr:hypothetical protein [Hanstruepera marina]
MSKKNPIKNSDPSINFRLPKELKASIEEKAQEKNQTSSAYLRDLLESVLNGDYCYKEQVKDRVESFLYSKEFLQLMIWIYRKKEIGELEIEKNELDRYIKTLKNIDGHLPQKITREFDKVLKDVIDLRDDNSYASRSKFEFHAASREYQKFNLKSVEEYFLDERMQQVFLNTKGVKNIEVPDLKGFNIPNLEQK